MKLISCHIENFGKLSDLRVDFVEGINLFHEMNGWGKSTLAAFLRVMFYGFDSKKESGSFDKERVVYRPWQGGTYGGEVDFSYQGKVYRISRTFGKTEKTDAFHLYDLMTNLECHDFSSDIGTEIFGLDSASFKRSAFIAQNDCESGSTDGINAKLGNLAENTNDINNFDTAQKKIHDRMNKLSPDRATGSMKKRKNTITLLTEELRSYDAAEKAMEDLSARLADKQDQRKELSNIRAKYAKALQVASEESRREGLKQNYAAICEEEEQCKKNLKAYDEIFENRVPEDSEFEEKNQEVQMLGVLKTTLYNLGLTDEEKAQYEKLSDMFGDGYPKESEIEAMDQELERLGKMREEKMQLETKISYFEAMAMKHEEPMVMMNHRLPLLIIAILCLVIGIGVSAVSFFVPALAKFSWVVLAVGIAVAVLGIVLLIARAALASADGRRAREQKIKQEEEQRKLRVPVEAIQKTMEEASEESQRIEEKVAEFLGQYHIFCAPADARSKLYELKNLLQEYERLKTRAARSDAAREEFDNTRNELLKFGEEAGIDFGEDIASGLSRLQMKAAEYRLASRACEQAKTKKAEFEKEHNMEELSSIERCPYTLDELNMMIQDVDERMEEVRVGIEQYSHQIEDLQEQLDIRDEKEQQLDICRREQEQEGHHYEVLALTQSFLQTAKEQFSARYLGPIENGFGKYYELLTGDHSGDWMVDANIAVQMKEQGEMRETKWLSAGYQDLLGICMRLALVDAMYPDEKPFLVLDDPFVNLDEEKVVHGNELLSKIAGEYQILYFTCHSSRM